MKAASRLHRQGSLTASEPLVRTGLPAESHTICWVAGKRFSYARSAAVAEAPNYSVIPTQVGIHLSSKNSANAGMESKEL
jgi:hypothetical protein